VPVLPLATLMGLAQLPVNPRLSVAFAVDACVSPSVTTLALVPRALKDVVALTVPALIATPDVYKVFAPLSVS